MNGLLIFRVDMTISRLEMQRSPNYIKSVAVYGGGIVGRGVVKGLTDLKIGNLQIHWYSQHLSEADENSLGYEETIILQDMKASDSLSTHQSIEGLLEVKPDVLVFANSYMMPRNLDFYKNLGGNRDKVVSYLYDNSVPKFRRLMDLMLHSQKQPLLMIVSNPPEKLAHLAMALGYDPCKILTSSPDKGRLANLVYLDLDIRSQFNSRLAKCEQILSPEHVDIPLLGEHSSPIVVPFFAGGTFNETLDGDFNREISRILQMRLRKFGPKVMASSIKGNVPYADAATRLVEDIERIYSGDLDSLQSVGYFQNFSLTHDGEKHPIRGFFYGLPPGISDEIRVKQPSPMDDSHVNGITLDDILQDSPSTKVDIIRQAQMQMSELA